MSHSFRLLPGSTINDHPATLGVMGGGQLGRMFVHAAQALGFATVVLDPDAHGPAASVSDHVIAGAYDDAGALAQMTARAVAVTTEFENVPAESLQTLAASVAVAPAASAVAVAQDRIQEKARFAVCADASGVAPAPHVVIQSAADLRAAEPLLPGILKTARLGYDGKGQARVATRAELADAWAQMGSVPCVLEQQLTLAYECSVIVARGRDGEIVNLPVQRNDHVNGILARTEVFSGNVPAAQASKALAATREIATQLDYVGVLCVEFFVLQDDTMVVNEMAPRPHNSGHYSIDACDLSQFDLQVRTLAGLPLPMPRQHSTAIMFNLLGDLWFSASGDAQIPPWGRLLALPGVHLHLYGKREARAGRKMGHVTVTAHDVPTLRANAQRVSALLGLDDGD